MIIQTIAKGLWNISELTGVGLGPLAPYVFGIMVGAKSVKKIK